MKHVLTLAVLVGAIGLQPTNAQEATTPDTLVWCGLDYSLVKMIGTMDFQESDRIFPEKLEAWNGLIMAEMTPKLEKLDASLRTDVKAVEKGNLKVSANCIVREDGTQAEMVTPTHITDKQIAAAIKAYSIKYKQGTGLVFIMDRLVKAQKTGCLYVVFFDIESRKVLLSERVCNGAEGIGFRNFWFRPIKTVIDKQLSGIYQKAKAARNH